MLCIVGVCAIIGIYITLHAYQWDMRADMTKGCCMWRVYTYIWAIYIHIIMGTVPLSSATYVCMCLQFVIMQCCSSPGLLQ